MDPEQICVFPSGFNWDSLEASWCGLSDRHSQDSWVLSRLTILLTSRNDKANSSGYCLGM